MLVQNSKFQYSSPCLFKDDIRLLITFTIKYQKLITSISIVLINIDYIIIKFIYYVKYFYFNNSVLFVTIYGYV